MANFISPISELSELYSRIDHSHVELHDRSVLKEIGTVKTGELILRLEGNENVYYRLYRLASVVITDRGTNFSSIQIRSLFNELKIEHHMVATGTPRGNGQVERYVSIY